MKKEIEHLLATDEAKLKINEIFTLERDLRADPLSNRTIDNVWLFCKLPGFPAQWSQRITARDYADVMAEVEATMVAMMTKATEDMARQFKNGYLQR